MLRDFGRALFDPRRFFGSLHERAPRAGRAYLALLVPTTLGSLLLLGRADTVLAQTLPFARELPPELLRTSFYVGTVLGGPLGALVAWGAGWLPIRIGAGHFPRIGEVAAWTQLPGTLTGLLTNATTVLGTLPAALVLAVHVAGVAWCGWLVYEGLRAFHPARVRRGVLVYALFALVPIALGFMVGFGGMPGAATSPEGLVF